jgi:hypothetical protein
MPATQRLRENKYNQFDINNKRFILILEIIPKNDFQKFNGLALAG